MKFVHNKKMVGSILMMILLISTDIIFILKPQFDHMDTLKCTLQKNQTKICDYKKILSKEDEILGKHKTLSYQLLQKNKKFFHNIKQQHILIWLHKILKDFPLDIETMDFSKEEDKVIQGYHVKLYQVMLPFEGTQNILLDFLKAIRTCNKKVIIRDLEINTENNGIYGKMNLDFYSIEDDSKDTSEDLDLKEPILYHNPFSSYKNIEYRNDERSNKVGTEEKEHILLDDFENIQMFFVASNEEIQGNLSSDLRSKEGSQALKLHIFNPENLQDTVNMVYEDKIVKLPQDAGKIGLWVYSEQKSHQTVEAVLKDHKGIYYEIPLVKDIDWIGWKYVESDIPKEIIYPVYIQRFSMSASESYKEITVLLDGLEAICKKNQEKNKGSLKYE